MRRPALSYANVMSTVAVFLAMSGTAVAATQISGTTIKDRTVGHKKLALNTVTGAEVSESTLARVPNADKLDGIDSTGFVKGAGVKVYRAVKSGLEDNSTATVPVFSWPNFGTLGVTCYGDSLAWIFTNTSTSREHASVFFGSGQPGSVTYDGGVMPPAPSLSDLFTEMHSNTGIGDGPFQDDISVVADDAARTTVNIHLAGATDVNGLNTCEVSGIAWMH